MDLDSIIHPEVRDSAFRQFEDGHLRDAVLNSVIAVFDLLRERSESELDGSDLVGEAFSLQNPKLIVSELDTESGRNDQKGFMQLMKGVYQGVRNPKAHSLRSDLTKEGAAQYLAFASLLARRIGEARIAFPKTEGLYLMYEPRIGNKALRFYPDGTVITVSTDSAEPRDLSWFTLKNADVKGYPKGTYTRDGTRLDFTVRWREGEIDYSGVVDNYNLHLDIHSKINGRRGNESFEYHWG